MNSIIEARESGAFKSFFDFAERLGHGNLNKRALEGLVGAGAFDSLKPESRVTHEWRGALFNSIDGALSRAQRARRERMLGQNGLFGSEPEDAGYVEQPAPTGVPGRLLKACSLRKARLGFYVTGHPLGGYTESVAVIKSHEVSRPSRPYQRESHLALVASSTIFSRGQPRKATGLLSCVSRTRRGEQSVYCGRKSTESIRAG